MILLAGLGSSGAGAQGGGLAPAAVETYLVSATSGGTANVNLPGAGGSAPLGAGVSLVSGQQVTVRATGSIDIDVTNPPSPHISPDPNGIGACDASCLLPGAPFGALVARVGGGAWQMVGAGPVKLSGVGEVQFAINDSTYSDNGGEYTVTMSDPVTLSATGPLTGLPNSPMSLSGAGSGGVAPLTYRWTGPAACTFADPAAAATQVSCNAPGDYQVTLTATDAEGVAASTTLTVRVAAAPAGPTWTTEAGRSAIAAYRDLHDFIPEDAPLEDGRASISAQCVAGKADTYRIGVHPYVGSGGEGARWAGLFGVVGVSAASEDQGVELVPLEVRSGPEFFEITVPSGMTAVVVWGEGPEDEPYVIDRTACLD
ncbi:MAG: hypothetical protein ACKVWR_04865 [Acidimicrobiales bacterium]